MSLLQHGDWPAPGYGQKRTIQSIEPDSDADARSTWLATLRDMEFFPGPFAKPSGARRLVSRDVPCREPGPHDGFRYEQPRRLSSVSPVPETIWPRVTLSRVPRICLPGPGCR